jgi:hypothetical protein
MAGPEILTDVNSIDDLEFERRALAAIRRELGLGGLARFLMTYRSGQGDYTAERQQWVDGITLDDLKRELEARNRNPAVLTTAST